MKNLLKVAVLAALLLPVACNNKETKPEDKGETLPPSTLTKPAQADHACVITVPQDQAPVVEVGEEFVGKLIRWINAPSGRYIAEFEVVEDKATKATTIIRLTGTYTYSDGVYNCSGDFNGTIEYDSENGELIVSPDGEEDVTIPASQQPTTTSGENETNACRTWTIAKIDLNLDKPAINHPFPDGTYKANSPYDIATYLKNHSVNVNPDKLKGYDVTEITLYPGVNMVQVSFTGKESYYGNFTLSGNNLKYDLKEFIKEDLFSGEANCELTFTGNNCLAKVSVKTEKLTGSATITLAEKK